MAIQARDGQLLLRDLLRLTPNDNDAYQRWRELSGKLSTALIAFSHASDRLHSYEQEHVTVSPPQ